MTADTSEPQIASFEAFGSLMPRTVEHRPSIDRVVRLMPGFVYVFNHQTYSNDYTNRSVGTHLGYSSEEIRTMGAAMMMRVVHADDQHLLGEHFARLSGLADEESASLEYRVITKQGRHLWLRSVDTVFDRTEDGKVARHIGVATDITVEKEASLALARLNAELEHKVATRTQDLAQLNADLEQRIESRTLELQEAFDELEQLTYIATHDLKVPVNNLSRLGMMLRNMSALSPTEQAEHIEWVNRCTEQLSAKIQGLVLVAQIRLSQNLPDEELNLRACVDKSLAAANEAMQSRPLPVTLDVPEDLTVPFTRFEMESILASLLDNAVKYADEARPLEISITASMSEGQVALAVKDNGTGIDPVRDTSKVFGLFQRAHKSPAGSGISLYCARQMLQRRGGALHVTGARGEGAEFTILFPSSEEQT